MTQAFAEAWMTRLRQILANRDEFALIRHLKELVPEYQISEFWANKMEKQETRVRVATV